MITTPWSPASTRAKDSGYQYHPFGYFKYWPYSACFSKYVGWGEWDIDLRSGLPIKPDPDDAILVHSTMVMNTFLGSADGNSVVNDTPDGPHRPHQIAMYTKLDDIRVYDDGRLVTYKDDEVLRLEPDIKAGRRTDCAPVGDDDVIRRDSLRDWRAQGYNAFLFQTSMSGLVGSCTIRPSLYLENATFGWDADMPLWSLLEIPPLGGKKDIPPSARCDKSTMGKRNAKYTNACVFVAANRVYTMYLDDPRRGEVAAHIRKAFTQPDDTEPKYDDAGKRLNKIIPGNADASLIKISKTTKAPDKASWYQKNIYRKNKVCATLSGTGDCDEFPFASTKQGVGYGYLQNGKWIPYFNFSIQRVSESHNCSAGGDLGVFYARYRVSSNQKFWVSIQDRMPTTLAQSPNRAGTQSDCSWP
ncbi:hypothetical protein ACFWY5_55870 [Nonomuraea sp. NPDC059007]|uniref:NucA/NucB deoxyribonuclease domain-containing protein n=1 Tax=Nonomuraea sp. NPDC059007 TaxID=3346692 RepID=UPI0036A126FA